MIMMGTNILGTFIPSIILKKARNRPMKGRVSTRKMMSGLIPDACNVATEWLNKPKISVSPQIVNSKLPKIMLLSPFDFMNLA